MTTITGKVAVVAKSGGVKLDGDERWFNPDKSLKDKIIGEGSKGKWGLL